MWIRQLCKSVKTKSNGRVFFREINEYEFPFNILMILYIYFLDTYAEEHTVQWEINNSLHSIIGIFQDTNLL